MPCAMMLMLGQCLLDVFMFRILFDNKQCKKVIAVTKTHLLGLEVADGERSTDDQSGFCFCFLALLTKDLPEAGLKGWQLLAMPAKDFPRTG